jgi:hypothetical protein
MINIVIVDTAGYMDDHCIVTRLLVGQLMSQGSVSSRVKSSSIASRLALGSTHPFVKWVAGFLSQTVK